MADLFQHSQLGIGETFDDGAPVTPSDSADLATFARVLWIGGAGGGTLRVTTTKGTTLNFAAVPVGRFPIRAKRVHATGTTVTDIVALW